MISGQASLYSVKVIKISRLYIDCLVILWSLHESLRCCEIDSTIFLSLDTQDIDNSDMSETTPETPCLFNCTYLTEITRMHPCDAREQFI